MRQGENSAITGQRECTSKNMRFLNPTGQATASRSQLDGRFIWQVVGCARSLPSTVVKVFQPSPRFSELYFTPFEKTAAKYSGSSWWSSLRMVISRPVMSVSVRPSSARANFDGSVVPALLNPA